MARYQGKEISFDVPEGWEDRSIIAFAEPPPKDRVAGMNVVLTYDTLVNESLNTYVAKLVTILARQHDEFDLIDRRDRRIAGAHAVELLFTWDSEGVPMLQHQVLFAPMPPKVWILTGTSPNAEAKRLAPAMEKILANVQIGAPAGAPTVGGLAPPPEIRR